MKAPFDNFSVNNSKWRYSKFVVIVWPYPSMKSGDKELNQSEVRRWLEDAMAEHGRESQRLNTFRARILGVPPK